MRVKKLTLVLLCYLVVCSCSNATDVRLEVPLVKQAEGRLCGPAAIEMVYRYWGNSTQDQYAIAGEIAKEFSTEKRFNGGEFLNTNDPADYPGTPVYIMRRYLESRADTDKYSLKSLPGEAVVLNQKFDRAFSWIKQHLDNGVPVIVHQYWSSPSSTGHYRVVTGYNDALQRVFLNDAKAGAIEQSYDEFKKKGAVDGKWLPYYSLAFNPRGKNPGAHNK